MIDGLEWNWRFIPELFEMDETRARMAARGIGADVAPVPGDYDRTVREVLAEATIEAPRDQRPILGGRRGHHSEHLGHILCADAVPAANLSGRDMVARAPLRIDPTRSDAIWAILEPLPILKFRSSPSSISASSATWTGPGDDHTHLYRLPGHFGDRADIREALDGAVFAASASKPSWRRPGRPTGSAKREERKLLAYGIAPPLTGGKPRRRMPAMRLDRDRRDQPVRIDAVQGAMALPCLPRAVRSFQMPLRTELSVRFPLPYHRRNRSRDRGRQIDPLRPCPRSSGTRSGSSRASI